MPHIAPHMGPPRAHHAADGEVEPHAHRIAGGEDAVAAARAVEEARLLGARLGGQGAVNDRAAVLAARFDRVPKRVHLCVRVCADDRAICVGEGGGGCSGSI
jgi:hypothetical protein